VKLPARARAVGKIILLGEHAVVYGRPALACGLPLGLGVEVGEAAGTPGLTTDRPELAGDDRPARVLAEAARALGIDANALAVRVRSEVPAGVGLGSSAALAVALVRALAAAVERRLEPADELALAMRLETVFHGHPSGIDTTAASLGTCFRFVRGAPATVEPIRAPRPLPLVIGFAERSRRTAAAVAAVRARWEADREGQERLFDAIAAVVADGVAAVARGDLVALGRAFDRNQRLLATLGVSTPGIAVLVAAAREAGALGAKLTGAGGGGAMIALAPDPTPVAAALAATGARTLTVAVGE
jgi:hydroxymethylglutaryl-CoA reductase